MDVLSRLTDKAALEKAYEAKSGKLTVIDAEEFAAKLKGRVIGQDEVIDHIARTLRRRIAAQQGRQRHRCAAAYGNGSPELAQPVCTMPINLDRGTYEAVFRVLSQSGLARL